MYHLHVDLNPEAGQRRYALLNHQEGLVGSFHTFGEALHAAMECGELTLEVRGLGGHTLGTFIIT